jgi:hypothetical protein
LLSARPSRAALTNRSRGAQREPAGGDDLASLDHAGEIGASVARRIRAAHPLGLHLALADAVVRDAVVARLAAASPATLDRAALLVAGEHTLKTRLGVLARHACIRYAALRFRLAASLIHRPSPATKSRGDTPRAAAASRRLSARHGVAASLLSGVLS